MKRDYYKITSTMHGINLNAKRIKVRKRKLDFFIETLRISKLLIRQKKEICNTIMTRRIVHVLGEGEHNMHMVLTFLFNIQMPRKIERSSLLLSSVPFTTAFLTISNSKAPFSFFSPLIYFYLLYITSQAFHLPFNMSRSFLPLGLYDTTLISYY